MDKCLKIYIKLSMSFVIMSGFALCFGLCPFFHSNVLAHILFGVASFQVIFLLTYLVIGIAIPSITQKPIDSLNIFLLTLFFTTIVAYQVDVLNEIVGDETYNDQLYEIFLDAIGTTFALLVYIGLFLMKHKRCQWKIIF